MTAVAIAKSRTERRLVFAGRVLAFAGAALGVVPCFIVFYEFDNGDKIFSDPIWVRIALCLWQIVPLPIAWWIGRRVARTTAALVVLLAGMALVVASETSYWDAFPPNVASGLVVTVVPMFQLLFLAMIVFIAWLTSCWTLWRSRRRPSADD
jgi:hypothetical protein